MILRFGACEVDLDRVEVRVDGSVVPVQPQVFDVIKYLAEHRHRVVTKEELLDNVWGDRFVGESTLTSRIKSARRALHDTGREQTVIRTVHGRGYHFVAEVELVDATAPAVTAAAATAAAASDAAPTRSTVRGERSAALATSAAGLPVGEGERAWPFVGRYEQVDEVLAVVADPAAGGLLLSGTSGAGTSRLLVECLRHCAADGHAVASTSGMASAASIPLAALAPFLPAEVLSFDGAPPDLARGVVFRRAQAALESLAPAQGRFVLAIDDADQLDELSEAVIASLVLADTLCVLAAHRPSTRPRRPFDDLVRAGRMATLDVPPLDENDIDVILYRVLEGPIDLTSLDRLARASAGRPGVLRDLVESSIASGALARDDGVWRLVGAVTSHRAAGWRGLELSDAAVRAAEQLALVSSLHLDDAMRILGPDAIDELDGARLLELERDADGDVVTLADPVLRDTLAASLGPVRARGLKQSLLGELLAGQRRPDDIATAVSWAEDLGVSVEPLEALLAARTALVRGRDDAAETLIDHLDRAAGAPSPFAQVIRAELCYRRAQFARAEELFGAIDLSVLDDMTAGFVLRRRSVIDYQVHGRYRESVAWLREQEAGAGDVRAASLAVHRLTLQTLLGDASHVIDESQRLLPGLPELLAIELRMSRARAMLMCGLIDATLAEIDAAERLLPAVQVPGPEQAMLREGALWLRLAALSTAGELERAAELARREDVAGRRSSRSWVPLMGAEIEIEAGRMRSARETARPALEAARGVRFENAIGAAEGVFAWALAGLGERAAAEPLLVSVEESLPRMAGANAWHMATSLGRALVALGEGEPAAVARRRRLVATILELADDAQRRGAVLSEANLRMTAVLVDQDPTTARGCADRIADATATIGGRLWPVKLRHVRALAASEPLAEIEADYRRLGYDHLADVAAR